MFFAIFIELPRQAFRLRTS